MNPDVLSASVFALIHLLLYLKLRPCLRFAMRTGAYVLWCTFFLAVPGNHEFHAGFGQAIDFMKRSGLAVLLDRAAEAHGIVVVGLDENGGDEFRPSDLNPSQDRFVLLLKHYPQPLKTNRG